MTLKQYSINKIMESNQRSKERAYHNQQRRLEYKQNIVILKYDNSRNLNKISLSQSESQLHNYAKFITGMALKQVKHDFINEYRLNDGKEVDIYDLNDNVFIEIQKANFEKKLENYRNEIDLGLINDIFIIPLDDFTGNLNEDLSMIKERLGVNARI